MSDVEAVLHQVTQRLARKPRTWLKYRTILSWADRKKNSPQFAAALEEALAAAGIHVCAERGSFAYCTPSDTVTVSYSQIWEPGLPFEDHRELGKFIERHFKALPPFRRCNRAVAERRMPYGDSHVVVDLYLTEPRGVVVCELEYDDGRYEPSSQIRRYIDAALAEEADGSRRAVRGVVITGAPNPDQEKEVSEFAQKEGVSVDWYYYRLSLDLQRADL